MEALPQGFQRRLVERPVRSSQCACGHLRCAVSRRIKIEVFRQTKLTPRSGLAFLCQGPRCVLCFSHALVAFLHSHMCLCFCFSVPMVLWATTPRCTHTTASGLCKRVHWLHNGVLVLVQAWFVCVHKHLFANPQHFDCEGVAENAVDSDISLILEQAPACRCSDIAI